MNDIVVSILMPTFNRADRIGNAIKSIVNQTYKDWELLIIDNGSTDNTREIVEKYSTLDLRVKYHNVEKSPNPGILDYLNYGVIFYLGKFIED